MNSIAYKVQIRGRVQGVAYRFWTRSEAKQLGLCGWVRNEPDGSVRALIIGPAARVDEMIRTLDKGPFGARVTEVLLESTEVDPGITDFRIS